MAIPPDSQFEAVSFVLTKDQVRRLRDLYQLRIVQVADMRRVTKSEVIREVVDEGLKAVLSDSNIALSASTGSDERAA